MNGELCFSLNRQVEKNAAREEMLAREHLREHRVVATEVVDQPGIDELLAQKLLCRDELLPDGSHARRFYLPEATGSRWAMSLARSLSARRLRISWNSFS